MPLVGFINPSHSERRKDGKVGHKPDWMPVEEMLQMARFQPPKWSPWPYELLNAVAENHQERDYLSTTALLSPCPRSLVLQRREDYVDSVDLNYASTRGTAIHSFLEGLARPDSWAEFRFHKTVEGIAMSGSPDLISGVVGGGEPTILWDYKTTENPPMYDYPWPSHKLQLQYNRYLVSNAESVDVPEHYDVRGRSSVLDVAHRLQFNHLAIVYIGPKGPKILEVTQGKYAEKKADIWSDDQVLEDMVPKMLMIQKALDSYPEWPDGAEELWGGDPGWACPGAPICKLPNCLAKRYPDNLVW